jgi:tetratricopeptide (TPR) repeat protein
VLNKSVSSNPIPSALAGILVLLVISACAPADVVETSSSAGEIPISTSSGAALALYEQGQYLLDVGRGVQARAKFIEALELDPGFVRAHLDRSNAALSFKEFQDCLDQASSHLDSVTDGEKLLVEINRTFLTNDTDKGVELATRLVALHPESARAAIVLAGLQAGQNQNGDARASFMRALELEPNAPGALFGIANNYLFGEPRNFETAEQFAGQFLEAYPDEAKGYELLGDIRRASNDLEGAREAYNQASDTDPTLGVAQHKKGHVNSFLGNIEEARIAYDAGIEVAEPENKAGYAVYKTFTMIHAGDIPAALDEMEALADSMEAMGTPADQLQGLQAFAMNSHATAAMHAGLLDRAAMSVKRGNELRMAIADNVGTEDATRLQTAACHQWDGLLAAYRGEPVKAAEHAEEIGALLLDDANPRKMEGYHYVLGMAAHRAGDMKLAAKHLRQADHANNMYIRYRLAEALDELGQTDEAAELFAQVGSYNFNSVGFALVGRDAAARSTG